MGIKQDLAHARTAQDIERKYAIKKSLKKTLDTAEEAQKKADNVESSMQEGLDEIAKNLKKETLQIVEQTKKELSNDIKDVSTTTETLAEEVETLSTEVSGLSTEVGKKLDADAAITVEQGEIDGWTYRKWNNGWVECFKTFQKLVQGEWTSWGTLYCVPLISDELLPFEFTSDKREFATIHSTADVMLISNECGATVGVYKACSPVMYTEDCTIQLDVRVVGMVEEENTDA